MSDSNDLPRPLGAQDPAVDRLGASMLPAALLSYERAAQACRSARSKLGQTLRSAGQEAGEAFLSLDSTVETIAYLAHAASEDAKLAAAFSAAVFDGLEATGRAQDDLRQIHARGAARAMVDCDCGKCETCTLAAKTRTEGGDVIEVFAAGILRASAEPSGLVTPEGAPLVMGPDNVTPINRHQRRADSARRRGAK